MTYLTKTPLNTNSYIKHWKPPQIYESWNTQPNTEVWGQLDLADTLQHITPVIRRVRNDTNTGNGNATNGTNGTNGTNDQHRVSLTTPSGVSHSDSLRIIVTAAESVISKGKS